MTARKIPTVLLAAVHLAMGALLASFLVRGELTLQQAWFPLALAVLGSSSLLFAERDPVVPILSLLLASLIPPFSFISPSEVEGLSEWFGTPIFWLWTCFLLLFPYVFVHFTLAFPVTSPWLERGTFRLAAIYLPYGAFQILNAFEVTEPLGNGLLLLAFPVGFVLGLALLLHRYRRSLTFSEKNRLRVILLGCLAGGLPRLIAAVAPGPFPGFLRDSAGLLLPVFPAALVLAVVKRHFADIGSGFERLLIYSTVSAGMINVFFLCTWAAAAVSGPTALGWGMLSLAAALTALLFYPISRWGGEFVSARFETAQRTEKVGSSIVPREFRPLRPNPYVVGNPIRSPEMFFGREEELRFIRRRLEGEPGCVIVLCGARRSGKTSILYQILNGRLGDGFVPAFIDMQSLVVQNDAELLRGLAEGVRSAVAGERDRSPIAVDGYRELTSYVDSVIAALGGSRLVLLVDEYELIDSKVDQGLITPEVYEYLNGLLERRGHLSLVLTGTKPLESSKRWEPLLSRSFYRKIGYLSYDDAVNLIRRPVEGRIDYRSGTVGELWRLTRGHPFFTQLFCQALVDSVNERRQNVVDRRILFDATKQVLENPPPQLLYIWNQFTSAERLTLSALATLLKTPESFLGLERCRYLLRSLPGDLPAELAGDRLPMIFEDLRMRGVLDRDRTRYRFSMDFVRLWIRSERSVWNVLNESES